MNSKTLRDNRFLPAWVVGVVLAIWAATVFTLAQNAQAAALTTTLSLGSTDPSVVDLQVFLAKDPSIYPEGKVTGYYGALTRAAVLRYQAANGIPQTGTVGPVMIGMIDAEMGLTEAVDGWPTDVYAPVIRGNLVTAARTSATVGWSTNDAATGRVYYSTSWPFLVETASRVTNSSYLNSHSLDITGLTPNTTYYFIKESVDSRGNVMWTTHQSFKTAQ